MAASGWTRADFDETIEVWPENWPAIDMFDALGTQWRLGGMGGAGGLDYRVVFEYLDRRGYRGTAWDDMFADLRVLECAALNTMNGKSIDQ